MQNIFLKMIGLRIYDDLVLAGSGLLIYNHQYLNKIIPALNIVYNHQVNMNYIAIILNR